VDAGAVVAGLAFDAAWLRARGYRPGRRRSRLTKSRTLAALLDAVTPTRPTWNGHSSSTWRDHVFAVNGFDLGAGYGGEDAVVGIRLENLGVRGKQVRHRAVCVHLHHQRPYADPEAGRVSRARRAGARARREVRAARGLAELDPIDAPAGTRGGAGGRA
jgi:hypothetical protein